MEDPRVLAALVASGVALVCSLAAAYFSFMASREKLREEYRVEFATERALRILLSRGWNLRSFETLKYHLKGFGDDELRKLLVGAGAIQFEVRDPEKIEYWGVVENTKGLLSSSDGGNFKLVGDPPRLSSISRSIVRTSNSN